MSPVILAPRETAPLPKASLPFRFALPAAVFCLTIAAFMPVLENGFVNWDDGMNFLENPNYRGLSWSHLQWMFTTLHGSNYRPVAWMTSGLDYLIWGMEAFGYHLTSLLLHGANALLVYHLARHLFASAGRGDQQEHGFRWAAGFSALLFSLHPLRVEVVAWASARNDVVAGFFSLATLVAYINYADLAEIPSKRSRWYAASVALFALSVLSKGSAMMLPLALVVLDLYPLRRLGANRRDWFNRRALGVWFEKVPFLLLAIGAAVVAVVAKQSTEGLTAWSGYGFGSREAQAAYGLIFYLAKTLHPAGLSPLYQLTDQFDPLDAFNLAAGVLVLVVTAGVYLARHSWPAGLAVWICYVAVLFPVSGVVQSGPQLVADRYSYVACLPIALLIGAAMFRFAQRAGAQKIAPFRMGLAVSLGCAGLVWFATLSWRQSQVWRNSSTLWNHVLSIDPGSSYAHNNLGSDLQGAGMLDEAREHYLRALAIKPDYLEAHINLGMVLGRQRRFEESTQHFQTGLRIAPRNWRVRYYLGINYANRGDWAKAAEQFREALRLDAGHSEIHFDLANVLQRQGRIDEAVSHLQEALRVEPGLVEARRQLERLRGSPKLNAKQR